TNNHPGTVRLMNILQHIEIVKKAYLHMKYDLFAETADGWTDEDQVRTFQFFNSDTGLKLKARLTNYVLRTAIQATGHQGNNAQFHNGVASGTEMAVMALQTHLAPPTRKSETSEEEPSEAEADLALL